MSQYIYIYRRNHNLVFGIDLSEVILIFLTSNVPIKQIIHTIFREKI